MAKKKQEMVKVMVRAGAPARGYGYGEGIFTVSAAIAEDMVKAKCADYITKPKPVSED